MEKRMKQGRVYFACVALMLLPTSYSSYAQKTKTKTYYRVQLVQGTSEEVQPITKHFEKNHPGIKFYTTYNAPNFQVGIGNCGSKRAAKKLKNYLKDEYPNLRIVECYPHWR